MDKVQQVFQHEEKDIGQEFGGELLKLLMIDI